MISKALKNRYVTDAGKSKAVVAKHEYAKAEEVIFTSEIIEKQKGLQPGYCLVFGNAFKVPIIVKMDIPNPVPNSHNVNVIKEWGMN